MLTTKRTSTLRSNYVFHGWIINGIKIAMFLHHMLPAKTKLEAHVNNTNRLFA